MNKSSLLSRDPAPAGLPSLVTWPGLTPFWAQHQLRPKCSAGFQVTQRRTERPQWHKPRDQLRALVHLPFLLGCPCTAPSLPSPPLGRPTSLTHVPSQDHNTRPGGSLTPAPGIQLADSPDAASPRQMFPQDFTDLFCFGFFNLI